MPRPRDRTAINSDARFEALRHEVTAYLMDMAMAREAAADDGRALPDITPVVFDSRPPRAYRAAAASPIQDRYVDFSQVRKIYPTPKGTLTVEIGRASCRERVCQDV